MSTSVTRRPSSITNSAVAGIDWINLTNAGASDNAWASAENTDGINPDVTKGLQGQGYGFTIPTAATNLLLSLGSERHGDSAVSAEDLSVYALDADGNPGLNNKAAAGMWPAADAIATYAGDGTYWGLTLTPALLNAALFGVRIRATVQPLHLGYIDDIPLTVTYDLPAPTGDWTYAVGRKYLAVDATGVTPPAGLSITNYAWDWGDLASGSGVTATHTYAAGGTYTVVLTITYDSGDTADISKEVIVPDPTITRVSPLRATLGATGTACTLTVTNAGAVQSTSTLTVGGQAVIVDTWADTSIAFHLDDSPATPYGGQDIVLTVAAVAATLRNGIYAYNGTDNDDTDNILERYLSNVWIDGLHVGLTGQDGLKWTQRVVDKRFTSDDTDSPAIIKRKIVGYDIELTLAQLFKNGTLLAAILGGTWDATGKTLTILGQAQQSEHSIMVVDSNGIIEYWSRCYVSGDLTMSINKDWGLAPIKFEAIGTDVQVLHKIDESALTWA